MATEPRRHGRLGGDVRLFERRRRVRRLSRRGRGVLVLALTPPSRWWRDLGVVERGEAVHAVPEPVGAKNHRHFHAKKAGAWRVEEN